MGHNHFYRAEAMRDFFARMAMKAARLLGHPLAFLIAVFIVIGWATMGPYLGYSETWQLVINTGTTIITFLSVFLIQNSQNRESLAMQLKLDEIVRSIKEARNEIIDLEDMPEAKLQQIAKEFSRDDSSSNPPKTRSRPSKSKKKPKRQP